MAPNTRLDRDRRHVTSLRNRMAKAAAADLGGPSFEKKVQAAREAVAYDLSAPADNRSARMALAEQAVRDAALSKGAKELEQQYRAAEADLADRTYPFRVTITDRVQGGAFTTLKTVRGKTYAFNRRTQPSQVMDLLLSEVPSLRGEKGYDVEDVSEAVEVDEPLEQPNDPDASAPPVSPVSGDSPETVGNILEHLGGKGNGKAAKSKGNAKGGK